mgnify:CR=1 FL=1
MDDVARFSEVAREFLSAIRVDCSMLRVLQDASVFLDETSPSAKQVGSLKW